MTFDVFILILFGLLILAGASSSAIGAYERVHTPPTPDDCGEDIATLEARVAALEARNSDGGEK